MTLNDKEITFSAASTIINLGVCLSLKLALSYLTVVLFWIYAMTFNKTAVANEIIKQARRLCVCTCARNQNEEGGFVRLWLGAAITMKDC